MSLSLPFERIKNIDIKYKHAVAGYIRNMQTSEIPESIQLIILLFYHEGIEVMKFSATFRTNGIYQLSDDDKCAKVISTGWNAGFILADADPVKSGIHCWRIKVKHQIYLIQQLQMTIIKTYFKDKEKSRINFCFVGSE